MGLGQVLKGDSRFIPLCDESVDCVITSPPYWSLRKYNIPDLVWDDGWRGQLGLEPTIDLYLKHLMQIMDDVWRVLKKEGTLWVNIGDSYSGSWGNYGSREGGQREVNMKRYDRRGATPENFKPGLTNCGIPPKSLCLIPERFSIAMVERGWILRNKIVWWKRNCMPSSAKDRFTVDWEPVYFFVKSGKYWFEQQYEAVLDDSKKRYEYDLSGCQTPGSAYPNEKREKPFTWKQNSQGRNRRCVWDVPTAPFSGSHFAVFPQALIEPMIKAGCPKGGVVLDPFIGSGTVGLVAERLNRNWVGIDLGYEDLSLKRVVGVQKEIF